MTPDMMGMVLLHALCAAVYALLVALILVRSRRSQTGLWLVGACTVTSAWALAVALKPADAVQGAPGWLELARSVAWYGFLLHLYRRSISGKRLLGQAFATMGGLALLLIGVMPLIDLLAGRDNFSL